jgi:multidrug efflux pump subunit AcrA (membrane-fusion protein)
MLPFVAAACSQQPQAPAPATPEVGVVTLQEQDAGIETLLPGRVVALETSEVRPQVNGIIRRRLFEEGALVSAGQVLYEIEDAPYRAALASAQGNLAMASASIRSTRLQADRYGRLLAVKGSASRTTTMPMPPRGRPPRPCRPAAPMSCRPMSALVSRASARPSAGASGVRC